MNVTFQHHGDPDGLLQTLWDHLRGRQELLLSPYLPALFALLTHLIICTPFLALDVLGCFWTRIDLYRISRSSEPQCLRRWVDCFWRILFKYITSLLPATALLQSLRTPRCPELAPTCGLLFLEVVACLLLFDTLFFIWHYFMHR